MVGVGGEGGPGRGWGATRGKVVNALIAESRGSGFQSQFRWQPSPPSSNVLFLDSVRWTQRLVLRMSRKPRDPVHYKLAHVKDTPTAGKKTTVMGKLSAVTLTLGIT